MSVARLEANPRSIAGSGDLTIATLCCAIGRSEHVGRSRFGLCCHLTIDLAAISTAEVVR